MRGKLVGSPARSRQDAGTAEHGRHLASLAQEMLGAALLDRFEGGVSPAPSAGG